jgi:hypothetical protein
MPEERGKIKWYHRPSVVIIALLGFGPFALPLVWASPKFTKWSKIIITFLVVALSVWLVKASVDLYQALLKHLRELQNAYNY